MIKVIIIDDEYLAREGMRKTIDWERYGCMLCGEADNGYKGVELAEKVEPDLIITDIKMPGIDGITMAKKIKEKFPECKFIIITGYDDFKYAQGAVKINAFDLLLKPVDENEFINAVKNAVKECNKTKENVSITRNKVLLDMMRGNIKDKKDIDEAISNFNIDADKMIILSFQNDNFESNNNSKAVRELLVRNFSCIDAYVIECHADRTALLASTGKLKNLSKFYKKVQEVQKELYDDYKIVVTAGVSNPKSMYELREAYEESKKALKYRMYKGNESIIYFDSIKCENLIRWESVTKKIKSIVLKLKACDRIKVQKELKMLYFNLFKENNIDDNVVKQASIEIIFESIKLLKEYNISVENLFRKNFNIYKETSSFETINEFYMFVKGVLSKVIDCIRENNALICDNGLEDVFKYIKVHFCEEISLSDVAGVAFMNESYLSRKIKKVMGISFIEYITKLRMDKAIEYLKDPNIKVTQMAQKLGYKDYRHFSQKFKEYTGYLPSEWKEKQRIKI